MSSGKRERILMIIILVLVIVNSATLLLMWINKPPFPPKHPRHGGPPDKIIIERLQLNENQQKKFEVIKKEHQGQMRELNEKVNNIHKNYFRLLESENVNDSLADVYEKELAAVAEKREEYTFEHFKKLKAICRPDQYKLYSDFIGELGKILSGPKGPPPPR